MEIVYKYKGNNGHLFTVKIKDKQVEVASTSYILFSDEYIKLLKSKNFVKAIELVSNELYHYYLFTFNKKASINDVHNLNLPFIFLP